MNCCLQEINMGSNREDILSYLKEMVGEELYKQFEELGVGKQNLKPELQKSE